MRNPKQTIALLAVCAVACGGDPPTAPEREITLSLCGGVAWAAYQNEGEAWTLLPSPSTGVTFTAKERLAIATVSRVGPSSDGPRLEIHYLTPEQAEATFVCNAPASGSSSTKQLHGRVAGVGPDATAHISMGREVTSATARFPTFLVRAVGDGPADLVATHELTSPPPLFSGRADKVIIRRGENHADGATMPVLDFSSAEAFAPQSNTLTIEGLFESGPLLVLMDVVTRRGAANVLMYDFDHSGTVVTTASLPASRLDDGDLHRANVTTADRSILFFYRAPADRRLTLGPAASTPTLTRPTGASDHLVRIDVASQAEYGSQINVLFRPPQPATPNHSVVITATREYFGGSPATWSLSLPDLTGLSGFSPLWGLSPGLRVWTLTVTGIPHGLSTTSARDGDVYRSASASGVTVIGPRSG